MAPYHISIHSSPASHSQCNTFCQWNSNTSMRLQWELRNGNVSIERITLANAVAI